MNRQQPMTDAENADTIQVIDSLTVIKLKDIARSIGLALSGRKAEIQDRIKQFYHNGRKANDNVRLQTIRTLALKAANNQDIPTYQSLYSAIQSNSYNYVAPNQYQSAPAVLHNSRTHSHTHGHSHTHTHGHGGQSKKSTASGSVRPWLYFRESPFYRLKRLVHGSPVLAYKAADTRGTCRLQFVLNESEANLLASGKQYQLLLLCGEYEAGSPTTEAFVQFPQPLEIHFNDVLLKDNVKGIKNKPGTARPANLTPYLKQPPYSNRLDIIYAFAKTDFLFFCYIVEMIPPEKVLLSIINQPHIVKEATLSEIRKEEAEQDDLVEMQEVLTLKCPLSYSKMKYPCKSVYCQHIQCFDCLAFLQLQEQASTWSCPICQKSITVKNLAIDDYLLEIIKNTGEDDEAVEIEKDGTWKVKSEDDGNNSSGSESNVFKAKSEETTPAIPEFRSTPKKDSEVIEIISLDSDSEEDNNDDEAVEEMLQPPLPPPSNPPPAIPAKAHTTLTSQIVAPAPEVVSAPQVLSSQALSPSEHNSSTTGPLSSGNDSESSGFDLSKTFPTDHNENRQLASNVQVDSSRNNNLNNNFDQATSSRLTSVSNVSSYPNPSLSARHYTVTQNPITVGEKPESIPEPAKTANASNEFTTLGLPNEHPEPSIQNSRSLPTDGTEQATRVMSSTSPSTSVTVNRQDVPASIPNTNPSKISSALPSWSENTLLRADNEMVQSPSVGRTSTVSETNYYSPSIFSSTQSYNSSMRHNRDTETGGDGLPLSNSTQQPQKVNLGFQVHSNVLSEIQTTSTADRNNIENGDSLNGESVSYEVSPRLPEFPDRGTSINASFLFNNNNQQKSSDQLENTKSNLESYPRNDNASLFGIQRIPNASTNQEWAKDRRMSESTSNGMRDSQLLRSPSRFVRPSPALDRYNVGSNNNSSNTFNADSVIPSPARTVQITSDEVLHSPHSSGQKRAHEIIDLTFSDEEDERPSKR
ncbi:hypothetical protein PACTADRAFT_32271 [Pachysolen tannophilus NRRL Y-2460]|uniref:Uncharacterized protein n=1 Tax=Pachysolen tannophilus NRRL Y-2460 TaxID=669874 RepID=A0A1E4TYD0_PACTA|nr:hypothetical protein PACTADRAFT_32271 [Pachysolen tannophilus NRRL Y-2460]